MLKKLQGSFKSLKKCKHYQWLIKMNLGWPSWIYHTQSIYYFSLETSFRSPWKIREDSIFRYSTEWWLKELWPLQVLKQFSCSHSSKHEADVNSTKCLRAVSWYLEIAHASDCALRTTQPPTPRNKAIDAIPWCLLFNHQLFTIINGWTTKSNVY